MGDFAGFLLCAAVALLIVLYSRTMDDLRFQRWQRENGFVSSRASGYGGRRQYDLTHPHWARVHMGETIRDTLGLENNYKEYHKVLSGYVYALTHGTSNSSWCLSPKGCVYLADAVKNGKTPDDVAVEVPNPTPIDLLDVSVLEVLGVKREA